MDERSIRERIRSQLEAGRLKRHDGMIMAAGIESRQTCQACGLAINPEYATPIGHAYVDGTHWFHLNLPCALGRRARGQRAADDQAGRRCRALHLARAPQSSSTTGFHTLALRGTHGDLERADDSLHDVHDVLPWPAAHCEQGGVLTGRRGHERDALGLGRAVAPCHAIETLRSGGAWH